MRKIKYSFLCIVLLFIVTPAGSVVITETEFNEVQARLRDLPTADRIAFWAEQFVGTPYDPDPLGEYVRRRVIKADERVDCMYATFRAVELSTSRDYIDTVSTALDVRFRTQGRLDEHGNVMNYEERYEYGIDMIRSGKFGRDVSGIVSPTTDLKGDRGIERVSIIERSAAIYSLKNIRNGDIIFFIKDPSKRIVGEIVGHIGIAAVNDSRVFLIHASGMKNGTGSVKKVPLKHYLENMAFVGIVVTRFD